MSADRSRRRPEHQLDEASEKVARRALLTGAAGAGAAAVAAHLTPNSGDAEPSSTARQGDDRRKLPYRETDHVRWFYARSRF